MIHIDKSLTRPVLPLGAEAMPLYALVLICLYFVFMMSFAFWAMAIAALTMSIGLHILRKLAEYNPRLFKVLWRRYFPLVTPKNLPAVPRYLDPPTE